MSKFKVYITRRIPDAGLELLNGHCEVTSWEGDDAIPKEEILKHVPGINGLLCMLTDDIDKDVIEKAGPSLKVITTMSVGFEHIDVEECRKRGITVANTPNVSTDSVAELTLSLLLLTARRLIEGVDSVKNGQWGPWKPMWLCGVELTGRTVGILGLGRIGYGVAKRVRPFGISRILYNDVCQVSHADEVGAEFTDFDTMIRESDVVIICCNLTESTKHRFNKDTFKKMKKTAILINSGRGGVVQHDDLYDALTSGEIYAAGLDVTEPEPLPHDHPLVGLQNCIILPHMGSNTWDSRIHMAETSAKNILSVKNGEVPYGLVK
ncbi:glyoxylate reductase/hydroxypyruvate reductase-like [Pecten maximus]|uniref:glyoxylate reductase/hydroxypyruvate reductase-like n=1 Tax=Pecten maximus TaxID=6579 RepID=UPI0014580774|nr:glyoxylate reductase/hydroxypyruvate reductase-like [Pecten maximus]